MPYRATRGAMEHPALRLFRRAQGCPERTEAHLSPKRRARPGSRPNPYLWPSGHLRGPPKGFEHGNEAPRWIDPEPVAAFGIIPCGCDFRPGSGPVREP